MVRIARGKVLGAGLGLVLAGLSTAPAPTPKEKENGPNLKALANARYQSSLRAYEESWIYYRQARTDPYFVYAWSRLVMGAESDLSAKKADRLAALEAHLGRMKKLQDLVKKVRKIGFQRSIDVAASDYFMREAEYWIAMAKTQNVPTIPPMIPVPYDMPIHVPFHPGG